MFHIGHLLTKRPTQGPPSHMLGGLFVWVIQTQKVKLQDCETNMTLWDEL